MGANKIMADANRIVRERQLAIRREMMRRGISLKALAHDSGIPYPTIISYFPGERDRDPATMPVSALFLLAGVLPADLLSLLLPDVFAIVHVGEGVDHDDLAAVCGDYLTAYTAARHPASESGVHIGAQETVRLDAAAARVKGAA
jgi:hypothetical protein